MGLLFRCSSVFVIQKDKRKREENRMRQCIEHLIISVM